MKPRIRLVTRADDAGSCRSANEAILEAVEAGAIKNVSFMAVGPEIEHAVELLGGRDDIAYGFHFCLNSEWEQIKWKPCTSSYALTGKDGQFFSHPLETKSQLEQIAAALVDDKNDFWEADAADINIWSEVDDEFLSQWRRLKKLGLSPSYVDEHMGIGRTIPYIRAHIQRFCQLNELVDAHVVPALPVVTATDDSLADIQSRLELATGSEYVWVTHPGKVAPDTNAFYLAGGEPGVIARERDAERQLLTDPRLPALFEKWNIRPTRYDELPAG